MVEHQKRPSGATEIHSIRFLPDGPPVPLELVRARTAGEVVFVVGAGASRGSGLPLFQDLTRAVYGDLTGADPEAADAIPPAEKAAYDAHSFDVALGLLEDRLDGDAASGTAARRHVRSAVAQALDVRKATGLDRHRHLLMLARDARMRPRLVTTNFDTLFEHAWTPVCGDSPPLRSRANANLPRPGAQDFFGVLHLHGRLADGSIQPPFIKEGNCHDWMCSRSQRRPRNCRALDRRRHCVDSEVV